MDSHYIFYSAVELSSIFSQPTSPRATLYPCTHPHDRGSAHVPAGGRRSGRRSRYVCHAWPAYGTAGRNPPISGSPVTSVYFFKLCRAKAVRCNRWSGYINSNLRLSLLEDIVCFFSVFVSIQADVHDKSRSYHGC